MSSMPDTLKMLHTEFVSMVLSQPGIAWAAKYLRAKWNFLSHGLLYTVQ